MRNLRKLTTESRNENTMQLDAMSTKEILEAINKEDQLVAQKVYEVLPEIERAIHIITKAMKAGGRLFYTGAGTSGRIGIQDAVECPPTYSTPTDVVQALIAGGEHAFIEAVEGAEDDESLGAQDLIEKNFTKKDVVLGIAASGRTPYVVGTLKYARKIGAKTISLASNLNSPISQHADVKIDIITGPEVLTGSTRMKAATAHKMILNMITTTTMIQLGKVYENLMVDLKVSNYKLKERAKSIVSTITSISVESAETILEKTNYAVKPAIVMVEAEVDFKTAQQLIEEADGFVRKAVELGLKQDTGNR